MKDQQTLVAICSLGSKVQSRPLRSQTLYSTVFAIGYSTRHCRTIKAHNSGIRHTLCTAKQCTLLLCILETSWPVLVRPKNQNVGRLILPRPFPNCPVKSCVFDFRRLIFQSRAPELGVSLLSRPLFRPLLRAGRTEIYRSSCNEIHADDVLSLKNHNHMPRRSQAIVHRTRRRFPLARLPWQNCGTNMMALNYLTASLPHTAPPFKRSFRSLSTLRYSPCVRPTARMGYSSSPRPSGIASPLGINRPLDRNLEDKILRGEYIDLAILLPDTVYQSQTPDIQLRLDDSSLGSPVTMVRKRKPVIDTFQKWLDTFTTFMLVIVATYPRRALELIKYQQIISRAVTKFKGLAWLAYDEQFRRRAAYDLSLSLGYRGLGALDDYLLGPSEARALSCLLQPVPPARRLLVQ